LSAVITSAIRAKLKPSVRGPITRPRLLPIGNVDSSQQMFAGVKRSVEKKLLVVATPE
jgi:hypothetical protein